MAAPQAQARRPFFRRRKTCPFSGANAPTIDYKDVRLLQRYVSERGKMLGPMLSTCNAISAVGPVIGGTVALSTR